MPFSLPTHARTVFHVSLHNQVRGHAIFEVVLKNRQPPASHNFIHHPREMTPTILSRTISPQLLDHVQISTEYHLSVHGLPSVLRRVPLGNGSRSHSLYHHRSQPEHFPQLRTGGAIGPPSGPLVSIIFVQLTTSRFGNITRLIHTHMTIERYILYLNIQQYRYICIMCHECSNTYVLSVHICTMIHISCPLPPKLVFGV